MRKLSESLLSSLALSILVGACGTAAGTGQADPSAITPPASDPAVTAESLRSGHYADKSSINVAKSASLSIGLRGGAVASLGDQTVQRALIDLQDVELVSSAGPSLRLLANPVTLDLFALQNDLAQIIQSQSLDAGVYSQIRCRIGGVFIETLDGSGNQVDYLSGDPSAFDDIPTQGNLPLEFGQVDADGGFNVGLPESGLAVNGDTSFALRFDLADSLFMQGSSLVFNPVVWAADAADLSSIEVAMQVSSDTDMSSFDGFQLELLDAAQVPVCFAPVVAAGNVLSATFQYLDVVEGPFTAVLVPPVGVALSNQIAVSIDVGVSVHAQATVSFQSVSRVDQGGGVVLDIRTENKAKYVEHSFKGAVVNTGTAPVGSFDQVAQPWQQVAPVAAHHPQWSQAGDMPTSQQPFDKRLGKGGVERPGHDTGPASEQPGGGGQSHSPDGKSPAQSEKSPVQPSGAGTNKNPGSGKNADPPSAHPNSPSNPPPKDNAPPTQPTKQSSAPPSDETPVKGKGDSPSGHNDAPPAQKTPASQPPKPSSDENPGPMKGSSSPSNGGAPPAQKTPASQPQKQSSDENPGPMKGSSLPSNGDAPPAQKTPSSPPPKQSSGEKNPGPMKGSSSPSNGDAPPAQKTPASPPQKQSSDDKNPGPMKGSSLPSNGDAPPAQKTPSSPPPKQSSGEDPGPMKGSSSPSNGDAPPAQKTPSSKPPAQSSPTPANHTGKDSAPAQSPPPKDTGNGSGDGGANPGHAHP